MDPRGANFIVRPRAQNCLATPVIAKPSSLIVGDSPLWGENKTDQDLFVPRTRTTMTICLDPFPSLALLLAWNRLPPSARASFLSSNLSTSLLRQQKFWAMNGAHFTSPIRGDLVYAHRP